MKHIVEIDDSSNTGKHLLNLLKNLSETNQGIDFPSLADIENKLDQRLIKLMKEGEKSGLADKAKVLKKLGI